jgi:ABC-type transport system involved in cytochrome bd biosynthesis fused ATPase/permease subunit
VPVLLLAFVWPVDRVSVATMAVTIPLIPVFMILIGLSAQAATRRQWLTLSLLGAHFLDVLQGLPTLKIFGRERAQLATIRAVTDRYRRATMGTLRVAFLPRWRWRCWPPSASPWSRWGSACAWSVAACASSPG